VGSGESFDFLCVLASSPAFCASAFREPPVELLVMPVMSVRAWTTHRGTEARGGGGHRCPAAPACEDGGLSDAEQQRVC